MLIYVSSVMLNCCAANLPVFCVLVHLKGFGRACEGLGMVTVLGRVSGSFQT